MTEIKPGTPRPWQTAEWAEGCCFDIESVAGQYIGSASFEPDDALMPSHAEAKANARYIVHTANAYPSLIAGLREAREALLDVTAAMRRYEMDVDAEAPAAHREMMRKAYAALAKLDTLLSQGGPAMTLHERTAYKAGYLESAMQALLLRLEWDSRENMADFVKRSLERADTVPARVLEGSGQ